MRPMASQAAIQSGPLGASSPTRVPLPTPMANSPLAMAAEAASASA